MRRSSVTHLSLLAAVIVTCLTVILGAHEYARSPVVPTAVVTGIMSTILFVVRAANAFAYDRDWLEKQLRQTLSYSYDDAESIARSVSGKQLRALERRIQDRAALRVQELEVARLEKGLDNTPEPTKARLTSNEAHRLYLTNQISYEEWRENRYN